MRGVSIKKIIMDKGLTQVELAKALDMPARNLSAALSTEDVRSSLIEGVAAALNISVSEIYGEAAAPTASAGAGGTAIAGSGNNLNTQIDKFLDLLREKDVQIGRFQSEIDSLIELLKSQSK